MSYVQRGPNSGPEVGGMNQSTSRVNIEDIPVGVTCRCNACEKNLVLLRWYPRRKWEQYAKVDIIRCPSCGAYCKYISGVELQFTLKVVGNSVCLAAKNSSLTPLVLFNVYNNLIDINLDILGRSGFNGILGIRDNSSHLAKIFFNHHGLQHLELDNNLSNRYDAVIDTNVQKLLKAK